MTEAMKTENLLPATSGGKNENDWLHELSGEQQRALMTNLVELDRDKALDYTSDYVTRIQYGILTIMEGMCEHVERAQMDGIVCFLGQGKLIKSGSFFHDMKIGSPNEMDFAYTFKRVDVDDFLQEYPELGRTDFDFFREIEKLCSYGVHKVSLTPPMLWKHGGCNSPSFSGLRRNGPAFMFQFIYMDQEHDKPDLHITIDLVIAIEVPLADFYQDVEKSVCAAPDDHIRHLERLGNVDHVWRLVPPPDGPHLTYTPSPAEASWLRQFDRDSPVKTIIRILKILNSTNLPSGPSICGKSHMYEPIDLAPGFDSCMGEVEREEFFKRHKVLTHQVSELVQSKHSLAQVKEVYQELPYMASYVFQTLTCILFVGCMEDRPEVQVCELWKVEDIPRVVASILDVIHTCVRFSRHKCTKDSAGSILELQIKHRRYRSKSIPKKIFKLLFKTESLMEHIKLMISQFHQLAGDISHTYKNEDGHYYSEGHWDIVHHRCSLLE